MSITPVAPRVAAPTQAPAHSHAHPHSHSHSVTAPTATAETAARGKQPGYLEPDVAAERLERGRIAEYTFGTPDPAVAAAGAPTYFRTYDQLKAALHDLAAKYPDLVQLEDIGDSVEKRDIWALRLTNRNSATADKPRVLHLAGEHAREIANPEIVMKWVEQTLAAYGHDPEATALLDTREIAIIPMMNPDGHAVVEQGYAQKNGGKLWHRKNTQAPDGTDLNRNYDFHWGGVGASSNPHSDTYRGASAASEPEVQAVQAFVTANKPGVMIDWHSYSKLNLFPWGDTRKKAPDYDGFMAIAKKFSTFNHYTPQQSIDLYPTTGTSKDWAYGTHGIAAFTIETGDSFHQSDKEFARTWAENSPIFQYAAKIADDPFTKGKGPDTLDVHVVTGAPGVGAGSRITAQVGGGRAAIRAAEWVIDPSVPAGRGTPLAAVDGAYDSVRELVSGTAAPGAAAGARLVYVRAQDTTGTWGPETAQWLTTPPRS